MNTETMRASDNYVLDVTGMSIDEAKALGLRASDNCVLNTTGMTIDEAEALGAYWLEDNRHGFSRYWIGAYAGDSVSAWACGDCGQFVEDEDEGCEHCGYGRDEDEEYDEDE